MFGGDRVSVRKGDKVRETDDEDSYTATWIYVTPLNDTLQNGSQGKVCDTYFTTSSTTYTVDETWSIFTLDVKGACVIHELGQRGCPQDSGTKGTGNPIACQHGVGAAECQTEAVSVEKQVQAPSPSGMWPPCTPGVPSTIACFPIRARRL